MFQFNKVITPAGTPNQKGTITVAEIEKMTMPEFLEFEGRLVNVRRRKRRDQAVWRSNTAITIAMAKETFRVGVGGADAFADDPTVTYTKTRAHTNMRLNGEFPKGSLVIVKGIESHFAAFQLRGTTYSGGQVVNPLGVAVGTATTYDAALFAHTVCRQFEVAFMRGEELIVDGLVEEFQQGNALSGLMGGAFGGIIQNAGYSNGGRLDNPQVLEGGEDFNVTVRPLTALDISTGTGLTLVNITIMTKLDTIELVRDNP